MSTVESIQPRRPEPPSVRPANAAPATPFAEMLDAAAPAEDPRPRTEAPERPERRSEADEPREPAPRTAKEGQPKLEGKEPVKAEQPAEAAPGQAAPKLTIDAALIEVAAIVEGETAEIESGTDPTLVPETQEGTAVLQVTVQAPVAVVAPAVPVDPAAPVAPAGEATPVEGIEAAGTPKAPTPQVPATAVPTAPVAPGLAAEIAPRQPPTADLSKEEVESEAQAEPAEKAAPDVTSEKPKQPRPAATPEIRLQPAPALTKAPDDAANPKVPELKVAPASHQAPEATAAPKPVEPKLDPAPAPRFEVNPSLNPVSQTLPTPTLWPHALRVASSQDPVPVAGLAVEIAARAIEGVKRFEIRLDPPELGRVEVRLDVDRAGNVSSRLIVERPETLDLLRRDAQSLERALQQAGLKTSENALQFSLRDQGFAHREQTPGEPGHTRLVISEEEAVPVETARRYGRILGLGGGVDISI